MKIKEFKENQDWIMKAFLNKKKVFAESVYDDTDKHIKILLDRICLNSINEIVFISNEDIVYNKIKQIKTEPRVKNYKDLVMQLLDDGYRPERCSWVLIKKNTRSVNIFHNEMLQYCGKEPNHYFQWDPEWLEEVEVDEM